MAIWHLGVGRRRAWGLLPFSGGGSWGPVSWTLPFYSHPFSTRIQGKSVHGQAQPLGCGMDSIPPGRGSRTGGVETTPKWQGWNATDSTHDDAGQGGPRRQNLKLRDLGTPRSPSAGSSLQLVRRWGNPSPTPVQRRRLEVVVWQFGLQVLVSHLPPRPALGFPLP